MPGRPYYYWISGLLLFLKRLDHLDKAPYNLSRRAAALAVYQKPLFMNLHTV